MAEIRITAGKISLPAELNNTPTAQQIWEALPLEGRANVWGDEIYFEIPVMASQSVEARVELEVGELGYWPVGHAFCIFWGPTPASQGDEIRAYSPVNVFGRLEGDPFAFESVPGGAEFRVERVEL